MAARRKRRLKATMGNLHAGHLSRSEAAHKVADRVVPVSCNCLVWCGRGLKLSALLKRCISAEGTDRLFAHVLA